MTLVPTTTAQIVSQVGKLTATTAAVVAMSLGMTVSFPSAAHASDDITSRLQVSVTASADSATSDISLSESDNFRGLICLHNKEMYSLAYKGSVSLPPIGRSLDSVVKQAFVASPIPDNKRTETVDNAKIAGTIVATTVLDADIDINKEALTAEAMLAAHRAANPGHPVAAVLLPTAVNIEGRSVRVTYSIAENTALRTVMDGALGRAEMFLAFPSGAFSMTRDNVGKGTDFASSFFNIEGSFRSELSHEGTSHVLTLNMETADASIPTVSLSRKITPALSVAYVSGTANKDLPAELVNKAPGRVDYPTVDAKPQAPAAPVEKTFKAADGTWTFSSYRPAATASVCGISFYEGVWTFASDTKDDQGTQPAPKDTPKAKDDNSSKKPNTNNADKPDSGQVTPKNVGQAKADSAHKGLARTGFGVGIAATGLVLLITGVGALLMRRRA